jgi:hypothetical protein
MTKDYTKTKNKNNYNPYHFNKLVEDALGNNKKQEEEKHSEKEEVPTTATLDSYFVKNKIAESYTFPPASIMISLSVNCSEIMI